MSIANNTAATPFVLPSGNDIYNSATFEIRSEGPGAINATGNYFGEPTTTELQAGQFNLTKIRDSRDDGTKGQVVIQTPYVTVPLNPEISDSSLPGGSVSAGYSKTLTAINGVAPYSWSTSSTLPTGLSLSATGTLSGTPTVAGTSTVTIRATDSAGAPKTGTKVFTLVINAAGMSPTIAAVSPNSGSIAGGTAVTITGSNFTSGATVRFGGTAATSVVVASATSITCTAPAHALGAVDVEVITGGQSIVSTSAYTYFDPATAPTVSAVSPTSGPTAGGTSVTLTGTNFAAGATVTFGGVAATNVVVASATSITCVTPARPAGAVNVVVTVGAASGTRANGFTYTAPPAPTISSISPNTGSTAGGTSVTITGTNYAAGATVTFSGASATNVAVASATSITCTTPAGTAGAVNVVVTVGAQSATSAGGFTYTAGVQLLGPTAYLSVLDSPFNQSLVFLEDFEDGALNVPGASANGAVTPPGEEGNIDSVDADDGAINGSGLLGHTFHNNNGAGGITFTFSAAVLGTLPTEAGIVWTDGAGTTTFEAFGAQGQSLGVIGPLALADAVFTGGTAEDRFLGVRNPAGISAIKISNSVGAIEVDHLQYSRGNTNPTISSISPTSGPTAGGTSVTFTGTNFAAGATVTFGGASATNVVVVSATSITCTTPAGTAGAVNVVVTVGAQSATSTGGFTYTSTSTGPSITVNADALSVAEGTSTTLRFINSDTAFVGFVTINFSLSGNAGRNTDYTLLTDDPAANTDIVQFPGGGLTLNALSDALATEGNETLTLTVLPGTGYSVGAASSVTITITDGASATPPLITSNLSDTATQNQTCRYTITATGSLPITFSTSPNPPAPGLALDPATGVITGTPTVSGAMSIDLTAANSAGSDTRRLTLLIAGNGTNPPAFLSPPTATPNPALINQDVVFSAAAIDADNDLLLYSWDFGDGTFGAGASPTHFYVVRGLYTAIVTVTDGRFTDARSLTVAVNDSAIPPDPLNRFTVVKSSVRFNFASSGKDALSLSGTIPIPPEFVPMGKDVTILFGDVEYINTLDVKGRAPDKTFRLLGKFAGEKLIVTPAKFKLSLKNRSLFADLEAYGFVNGDARDELVDVPVLIVLDTIAYFETVTFIYSANGNRNGRGKQK